ncbi:hypothetical protein HDU79_005392 [Rhizoclosmatium sp. JEL0117]|nr:hypothetical protein HDU79_005392 [Rhizoclosmatium sp. JEL0117]
MASCGTTPALVHYEPHPMTQRARLMLVSEQDEMATAAEAFELLKQMHGPKLIHPSHPIVKSTQRIVDRLVAVVGKNLREWELFVIDDPNTVNAMVLANGKIFVFTGLLNALWAMDNQYQQQQLKPSNSSTSWFQATLNFLWSLPLFPPTSDTQYIESHPIYIDSLAAVLAHEMAHVLSRHSAEDMGTTQLFQIFQDAIHATLYIFSINLPFLGDVVGRSVDVAAPYLSTLPYSRLMEIEADVIGIFLMAVAGYNPQRASQFWQHLASQDLANSPTHPFAEFTSTHPSHTHRAIELAKHEPAASEIYKAHKRIEDALKLNLARAKNSGNTGKRVKSELEHLNHGMYEVLGEFIGGKDTFWYARRDFDKVFIERSLRIVEEVRKEEEEASRTNAT